MNITYLRSSSIGSYELCPNSFWIEYCLGHKTPSNSKAAKGSITHKVLEILAMAKLANQNGLVNFTESESNHTFLAYPNIEINEAMDVAWNYYTQGPESHHKWEKSDYEDCFKWVNMALDFNDGMFSPLKRNVFWPEQYFDLEITREDAAYYVDGVKHYLRIRGTIDLLTKLEDPGIYELIDWKTGQKLNWGTGQRKTYQTLLKDKQLVMYYYALRRILPDAKQIIMTIMYIRDGGPTSMVYNDKSFKDAEQMIVDKFNEIRNCQKPKLIYPAMPCWSFCLLGKHTKDGNKTKIYKESKCYTMNQELKQIGLEKMQEKYGNKASIESYTGGGKVAHKE